MGSHAAAIQTRSLSPTEATGCNIFKNGSDPPILPDSEYPDWLWKLATPGATLKELERKGPDNLDMDEVSPEKEEGGCCLRLAFPVFHYLLPAH